MKKVFLLTNILSPYRIPLFNALSQILSEKRIQFKVVFMAESEHNRDWRLRKDELKVSYKVLQGWHYFIWSYELPVHINWTIWQFLQKESPDVIISGGYSYLSNWIALLYCKLHKRKLILWTSTTPECMRGRDPLRSMLRKSFIKACDAFITYGKRAAHFLEQLELDSRSIFVGCNVGDVEFFNKAVTAYRESPNFQEEKAKFSGPLLLYVGQLIPRKGILQLITALSGLRSQPWDLLIVGSGPLRREVEKQAKVNGIEDKVHFLGFHEKEDLVKFYALADIFVLPSLQEPYAIVISEALASGLFVIASKYDGATWDLITEQNGIIVDPVDIESLRLAIRKALDLALNRALKRESIMATVVDKNPTKYAQAFVEGIDYVLS